MRSGGYSHGTARRSRTCDCVRCEQYKSLRRRQRETELRSAIVSFIPVAFYAEGDRQDSMHVFCVEGNGHTVRECIDHAKALAHRWKGECVALCYSTPDMVLGDLRGRSTLRYASRMVEL